MLTVLFIVLAAAAIVMTGEAVRGQCRRMLARPVPLVSANDTVAPQLVAEVQPVRVA